MIKIAIALCSGIILIFALTNVNFLKKIYVVAFHKNAVLGRLNADNEWQGEVDTYVNGKLVRKSNFKNGLFEGWTLNYYPDGVVRKKSFYRGNTIDSVETNYYPDGKVRSTEMYRAGKYEGLRTLYYHSGKVENKSQRKNNQVNGMEYEYYESGSLKYKRVWVNNRLYGDQYYYYENGKVKIYHAYDVLGVKFYLSAYAESGKNVKTDGYPVSPNIYSKSEYADSVKVLEENHRYNSIRDLYVTVANPPDISTATKISINNKLRKDLVFLDNNTIKVVNAFPNKGSYDIVLDGVFVNKSSMIVNGVKAHLTIVREK